MKPLEAPLYVRSHDLARWTLERVLSWPADAHVLIGVPLADQVQTLLREVSLALTFLHDRPTHIQEADRAIVGIRVSLRLARDLGLLPASSHRYAQAELLEIGRMVGGWRKRWRTRKETQEERDEEVGQGPSRPRHPRRELGERPEEVPRGLPEQEAPRGQEQEPGVPRAPAPRPEPGGQGTGNGDER